MGQYFRRKAGPLLPASPPATSTLTLSPAVPLQAGQARGPEPMSQNWGQPCSGRWPWHGNRPLLEKPVGGEGHEGSCILLSSGPKRTPWPHLELGLCQCPALKKPSGTVAGRLRSKNPVPPGCERGRRAAWEGALRAGWPGPDTAMPFRVRPGLPASLCSSRPSLEPRTAPGGGGRGRAVLSTAGFVLRVRRPRGSPQPRHRMLGAVVRCARL